MALTETPRRLLLRPVLWVLVFGTLLAYGGYAFLHIPVEVLPQFGFPEISVIAHQAGATAGEMEAGIVRPLEGRILELPDLARERAVMGNGTVEFDLRFRDGTNTAQDLAAVNSAIDRARGRLPASAHPTARIMGAAIDEVADYAVAIPSAVAPATVLRAIRASILPALRAVPGVRRVEAFGIGNEVLWVQPDLAALRQAGVSVASLVAALRAQVLLRPGGYLSLGHQDALIEARSLPTTVAALERIAVAGPAGPIPLRDLARIVRGPMPSHNAVLLDGREAVALTVFKQAGASTIPVTREVQATLDATIGQLPRGVRWIRIYDQGHIVHLIGADLGRNLLVGALLAIAVLIAVLGAGRGIWVLALSIPLSLVAAIAGLYAAGQSLNLMTLGALTVAVGLLADDAIIVLESIYHRWEQGDGRWDGIRRGLRDIAGPDITGTLSTVAVFLPLLFVGGLAGLFFVPFALAMALALLASLLVSLSAIPLGLGFIGARPRAVPTAGGRGLDRLRRLNLRLFDLAVRHPRAGLAACVALLAASLVALVVVPINFLPLPNEGVLLESFPLPPGSALTQTEAAVRTITARLRADPAVAHTYARIGSASGTAYTEPAYAGEIEILLRPGVAVNSLDRIGRRLLRISRTAGVQLSLDTPTVERLGESLSGLPQPFVIHLFGARLAGLRTASRRIVARLRGVPGLSDIFNNDGYPVTQITLTPRPDALAGQGMTPAQLYGQLRPLLRGELVAEVPDGNLPLGLYVRLADATALSPDALRRLPVRTRGWTPLGQLAHVRLVAGPNQIRHLDGARALDILATPGGSLGAAIAGARRALTGLRLPAGYRIAFGGLYPQLIDAAIGLAVAAGAAFVLMACVLMLQFDGLLVPGLLLLQIPLAFTGGAAALALSGVGLNASGLVAFLTLVGISLNHGIVLLYRVRRNEAEGQAVEAAVREAVAVRFRPILLTTLTAVLGMLPTALGWGAGAAPEQGLAVVILGGIVWSALLSTNLIPALYLHRRRRRAAPTP